MQFVIDRVTVCSTHQMSYSPSVEDAPGTFPMFFTFLQCVLFQEIFGQHDLLKQGHVLAEHYGVGTRSPTNTFLKGTGSVFSITNLDQVPKLLFLVCKTRICLYPIVTGGA